MAKVKSTAEIAEKWSRVTPARSEDYRAGIENPRVDWATAAAQAEDNWGAGVTAAATRKAYGTGVKRAGTSKWKEKSLAKGVSRFSEGVALAANDYESGFGPYRDVIDKTVLPPRRTKGDPGNIERVRVIAQALRAHKVKAK